MDNNMHLDSTNILLENAYLYMQVTIFHEHNLYVISSIYNYYVELSEFTLSIQNRLLFISISLHFLP